MVKTLSLIGLLTLAGCQATGGSYCDIARPIVLSTAAIDAMDDQDVTAVLTHNETVEALCR